MSIAPRGHSILELYRMYRDGKLMVNRKYQRKLVWSIDEKAALIDSILAGYPIPLILLAELSRDGDSVTYEIIDGMQRLNAIFSFIENEFPMSGELFFDVAQSPHAKNLADQSVFEAKEPATSGFLDSKQCADFLEYQLAVTVFKASSDEQVNEIFGRINSNGKHLSPQEVRQAGVTSELATLVRELGAELRGDVTQEALPLYNMPEISIGSARRALRYGVTAEETFWCSQGIIRVSQLRDSEDEQILADLVLSIALQTPFPASKEEFDAYYGKGDEDKRPEIRAALLTYGIDNLKADIKAVVSAIQTTVTTVNGGATLKKILNPNAGSNPVKEPFYSMFMAYYQLMIADGKEPDDYQGILGALTDLAEKVKAGHKHVVASERKKNIDLSIGLIQGYFKKGDEPRRSPGLVSIDFENFVRRSKIEASYYDFKQGFLRAHPHDRSFDEDSFDKILQNIAAMANLGKHKIGCLFIGVTDKEADTQQVEKLDGITAPRLGMFGVVGLEREAAIRGLKPEQYLGFIADKIKQSALPDWLRLSVVAALTPLTYRGKTVFMIEVNAGSEPAWYKGRLITRHGPNRKDVTDDGASIAAVYSLFR